MKRNYIIFILLLVLTAIIYIFINYSIKAPIKGEVKEKLANTYPTKGNNIERDITKKRTNNIKKLENIDLTNPYKDMLIRRLERRNVRNPTEQEIDEEMTKIRDLIYRTDEYIFSMAAEGFNYLMEGEDRDKEWEMQVKDFINENMKKEYMSNTKAEEIYCTRRVCKIHFEHKNKDVRKEFVDIGSNEIINGINGGNMYAENTEDNSGTTGTNLYVTYKTDKAIMIDLREAIDQIIDDDKNSQISSI